MNRKPRLLYLVTSSLSVRFLRGQLSFMRRRGFDVAAISSPGPDLTRAGEEERVEVVGLPMEREIRPARDALALVRLARHFRASRPDLVVAATPKAGLLGMMAAWWTSVPVRVYHQFGLRLETARGLKREVLALAERVAMSCAGRVVCVSESLRRRCVEEGLAPAAKTVVLGPGSVNGVDADRFLPTDARRERAAAVRSLLGIPPEAPVVGFIGRLTRDKGIVELQEAFEIVRRQVGEARLLLVGDFEEGDAVPEGCIRRLMTDAQVAISAFVEDPVPYYHAMDVLAFPSFREGFPNVPLEASVAGLPVAAFRATGTLDAVIDGVTGTLVPQGDSGALAAAVVRYLRDADLRRRHGEAGRQRVLRDFRPDRVWEAFYQEFVSLLRKAGGPLPREEAVAGERAAVQVV